tara:strand:- start:4593 stop:5678 length:1086 start_codon:yes stop_codon:yes gene_type:complete
MSAYIYPFVFLSFLTIFENINKFCKILDNKFFYYLVSIFFIFFIGLRLEIGCDWSRYVLMFDKYEVLSFWEILKNNFISGHKLQELGHILITIISKNIYTLNTIYAILFTIPLFYFCSKLKRKYLSLLVSYPYYIVVVGMGPIRQAACISILMLSIILVSNKKYYLYFLNTVFSLLIHQFSIIFNGLILIHNLPRLIRTKFRKNNILYLLIIITIIIFCSPSIIDKTFYYFKLYGTIISPAKSAIYLWFIHFIPSIIFLSNINKFNLEKSLKKILISFSIFGFVILPIIFINSVIAYRLLLYLFPSSILITSYIPDLSLFKINSSIILYSIVMSSLFSLLIWLNLAFHSSCWVPYKNILIK